MLLLQIFKMVFINNNNFNLILLRLVYNQVILVKVKNNRNPFVTYPPIPGFQHRTWHKVPCVEIPSAPA
jgi:hypothetical protein